MTTTDEKIEQQAKLCEEKRESLRKEIAACREEVGAVKGDTKEILGVLRGEGDDAGLVGKVQGHEKRLNSHGLSLKALWGFLSSSALMVFGLFLKKS